MYAPLALLALTLTLTGCYGAGPLVRYDQQQQEFFRTYQQNSYRNVYSQPMCMPAGSGMVTCF